MIKRKIVGIFPSLLKISVYSYFFFCIITLFFKALLPCESKYLTLWLIWNTYVHVGETELCHDREVCPIHLSIFCQLFVCSKYEEHMEKVNETAQELVKGSATLLCPCPAMPCHAAFRDQERYKTILPTGVLCAL